MKTYRVVFLPEARLEALSAAEYIARTAPINAARWYEGLKKAVDGLRLMPYRYARAPESEFLGEDLRHLLYKSHRIIFRIDKAARTVCVLHVRHAQRRAIGEPDPGD